MEGVIHVPSLNIFVIHDGSKMPPSIHEQAQANPGDYKFGERRSQFRPSQHGCGTGSGDNCNFSSLTYIVGRFESVVLS